jgi:hypothetical protein
LPDEADGMSKVTVHVASGGGLNVNGVIREYIVNAGATVNPGDFVEFVTNYNKGEFNSGATSHISACKLGNNRILLVYKDEGTNGYGSAIVLSIRDGVVSTGREVILGMTDDDREAYAFSATALTDRKAAVAYIQKPTASSTNYMIIVQVLNIDETTITTTLPYESRAVCTDRSQCKIVGLGTDTILTMGINNNNLNAVAAKVTDEGILFGSNIIVGNCSSHLSASALTDTKAIISYTT